MHLNQLIFYSDLPPGLIKPEYNSNEHYNRTSLIFATLGKPLPRLGTKLAKKVCLIIKIAYVLNKHALRNLITL